MPTLSPRGPGAHSHPRTTPRVARFVLAALAAAAPSAPAGAQAPHYALPPVEIERRLGEEPFEISGMADNRWEGDRTQRAMLRFRDGIALPVKWARSARGGFELNNQPQYELAAYRLQSLFLDREDWVVPPTVLRVMPLGVYRQLDSELEPTFEGTTSVLVLLQYWLNAVEPLEKPDPARLDDARYLRRLSHLNVLTHLIRHADSNAGNVLIARNGEPRMFAVDNGVAFGSPDSPRGTFWKDLHVTRLPAGTVDRLRAIDRPTLARVLGTVAELRVTEAGRLEPVPAGATGPRRRPHRGIDFADGVVQMGLTDREVTDLWMRLQHLLRRVDAGEITTY
ncbi:MAG: hypothetical protein KY466_03980 [Gemmatimonadetes bacterium]|nr:hypothetical protein [Gemmatimonadota bacterium]